MMIIHDNMSGLSWPGVIMSGWWMLGPLQTHQCCGSGVSEIVSVSDVRLYRSRVSEEKPESKQSWGQCKHQLCLIGCWVTPGDSDVWSGDQVIRRSGWPSWCWLGLKCPLSFTFLTIWLQVKFFIYGFGRVDIIFLFNIYVFLRPGGFSIFIITAWVKWQKIL